MVSIYAEIALSTVVLVVTIGGGGKYRRFMVSVSFNTYT
jgi:hypothetical protein